MRLSFLALLTVLVAGPAAADVNTLFRCNASAAYTIENGRFVAADWAAKAIEMYRNMIVDGQTGLIRYGN